MDPKDLEFEETLADSELLLKNTARSMDEDAEFTLESILAEYGSGTPAAPEPEEKEPEPPAEKKPPAKVVPLPKKAEAAKKTVDETADETARIPVIPFPGAKKAEEPIEAEPEEETDAETEEEPPQDDEPKSMSLQDILAQTVQEALSEREDTIIEEEPPRRGLFSRRKMRDTEQLYDDAEEEEDEEEEFRTRAPRAAADRNALRLPRPAFGRDEGAPWGGYFHAFAVRHSGAGAFFHPAGGVHR